ncbi:MAG: hypothetical protein IIA73_01270 [Proteobacteria bacterium]|nr:hypothetical protein [Pseudomonadota bacterium]
MAEQRVAIVTQAKARHGRGLRPRARGALEGDPDVEARALGQRDQGFEVEAVDAPEDSFHTA